MVAAPRRPPPPAGEALTGGRVARIRRRLLDWYAEHGQPFPWRDPPDPYRALVAGVCAQQTQMSRVLPLWERWMAAYPDLAALAAAEPEAVLRTWAGAGYPRRALYLRDAAQRCMEEHDGRVPRERDALLALPGVGPFTAAIVRSLGHRADEAAVDTNVVRLLGRLVYGDLQPATETSPAAVEATARHLLPRGRAHLWNPALMDHGALVCTPQPRCAVCTLATLCRARPRFRAGERAQPVRAQAPFAGSDRQRRGALLRRLRAAPGPLPTAALLRDLAGAAPPPPRPAAVTPAGGAGTSAAAERARWRAILRGLERDGLAWSAGGRTGLGAAPPPGATDHE